MCAVLRRAIGAATGELLALLVTAMPRTFDPDRLRAVLSVVQGLLQEMRVATQRERDAIEAVPADYRASAQNLIHYLTVRAHDLRPLQGELAALSLSSLGRMEGHTLGTLSGVERALLALLGDPRAPSDAEAHPSAAEAADLLASRSSQLLGERPRTQPARIMVTLPGEAGRDPELLRRLLEAGMDLVRINLAHDDAATWSAMVRALRTAEVETGRHCRIFVDLPGPKLRTGEVEPGPSVLRLRPRRDLFGRTIEPVEVTLLEPGACSTAPGLHVPLRERVAVPVMPGDQFQVHDARGRWRLLVVVDVAGGVFHCVSSRTAYLIPDCEIVLRRGGVALWGGTIGDLPSLPGEIPLVNGDLLVLTKAQVPGHAARLGAEGPVVARVPCTLPEVFAAAQPGQRVLFDDGKISSRIERCSANEIEVRILETPPGGARLRAQKGINLPDTDLRMQALTVQDRQCLDWVAAHADVLGMSFVQHPEDVVALHEELERRGRGDMGIVLKIETRLAFERLPELLLTGLRSPPLGVMVARGDLAVEVGFARLAEVQEEILWLCEAAHVPVIWATQVLDSMARTGTPSRAEVTDAAMSVRAECVMLNKGPYVVETVRFLAGVLQRMQDHHAKKSSMLRSLSVAGRLPGALKAARPGEHAAQP